MDEGCINTPNSENSGLVVVNRAKKSTSLGDIRPKSESKFYIENNSKIKQPEKESNHLKEAMRILSIRCCDLAHETRLSRSYISRIQHENIKIIQSTKLKIVKALSALSGAVIFPTVIFPIFSSSVEEFNQFLF